MHKTLQAVSRSSPQALACVAFVLGLLLVETQCPAQTTSAPPTTTARNGQVVQLDQPPPAQDNVFSGNPMGFTSDGNKNVNLSPAVQDRIERFKQDAKLYMEKQEALKKQLQGANDTDRARIREQLRALRQEWLDRAREIRSDTKARIRELPSSYNELKNSLQKQEPQSGRRHRPGT